MQTRKDVSKIVRDLVKEWKRKGHTPYHINSGNCDTFAMELCDRIPFGGMMWGDEVPEMFHNPDICEGHCFFEFDGYFYDSECPNGVKRPDNLPFYKRLK